MNRNILDNNRAKEIIGDLLLKLNITSVVYIDDGFELTHSAEKAIAYTIDAYERQPEEVVSFIPEIDFNVPEYGWVRDFRQLWQQFDVSRRIGVISYMSKVSGTPIEELRFASSLLGLFPENIRIIELSPSAWEEMHQDLLREVSSESKVLCFFDQDLSEAPGYTSTGARSGIGLLKNYTNSEYYANSFCGLLTHTLDKENEMKAWRQLAMANELQLSMFLPIAKERLQSPVDFASGITKTTLNIYSEKMKKHVVDVLHEASKSAIEEFLAIDVYDFDHITVQSSFKEGVAETETLTRVYQIFHQDHVKRNLLNREQVRDFYQIVESVRILGEVGKALRSDRPDQRWGLRHQELYEDAELVNSNHSPIQNGDVFQLTGIEDAWYVLIAQPCDLMVRSNGLRGAHGTDKTGTLIPIERKSRKKAAELNPEQKGLLPYFFKASPDVGVANFNRAHIVRLDILDLAVFDAHGKCTVNTTGEPGTPPPQLHTAWRERFLKLHGVYREHAGVVVKLLQHIETIDDADLKQKGISAILPKMSMGNVGAVATTFDGGVFDFHIRRTQRLRPHIANRLLTTYTRFLARDAEEHDFS